METNVKYDRVLYIIVIILINMRTKYIYDIFVQTKRVVLYDLNYKCLDRIILYNVPSNGTILNV